MSGIGYNPYSPGGAREGGIINASRVHNSPYEARMTDLQGGRQSFNPLPRPVNPRLGDRKKKGPLTACEKKKIAK